MEYEMEDLGIMHDFSDLEVWQKPSKIMVSQGKYAVEILMRFGTMDWESMTMPKTMDLFLVILHLRELMPPYIGR